MMQALSIDFSRTPPYTGDMKTGRPSRRKSSDFGERLAALREQRGMSQSQLAEAMGITQGSIARWEKRPVAMPPEQMLQLAQVLGVSVRLLLGEEEMPKEPPGPSGRLRRVLREAGQLPRRQQEKIVDVIEAYIKQKQAEVR